MMRLSNGNPVSNPLARTSPPRERTEWEKRARKALDSWGGGSEISVAIAIEDSFRDGIKRAAAFAEEKGQRELAMTLRRLVERGSDENVPDPAGNR